MGKKRNTIHTTGTGMSIPDKAISPIFKVSVNAIEKLKQRVQDKLIDENILYHLSSVSKKVENFYQKCGKDEARKWYNAISGKG